MGCADTTATGHHLAPHPNPLPKWERESGCGRFRFRFPTSCFSPLSFFGRGVGGEAATSP
jgi:hypothetical protein